MKIIDILIVATVLFCAFRGGRRGLWLTLARLFGVFGAAAIAWFLHPAVKAWLKDEPQLMTGLQKSLVGPFMASVSPQGTQGVLVKLAEVLNQSQLPGFIKKMLLTSGDAPAGVLVTLNETTLSLVSFVALLLAAMVIIQGAVLILDRFFKLPVLSLLNRSTGMVLGFSEGVFLLWMTLAVLTPIIAFRPDGMLAKVIRTSRLADWLYQNNLLLTLIDFTFK